MRILHLCLACFYIDGYGYQENTLPRIHKEDGNEVFIIASTETFIDNRQLGYVEPSEYETEYGVPIKRLPYAKILPHGIMRKFRYYPYLYKEVEVFRPDVIMIHDLCFGSIKDIILYKKRHPKVLLYADTHTDANNSGTNWLSLHVLHRTFYKCLVQHALPYVEKYFYISEECKDFSLRNYKTSLEKMEFFPLGGVVLSHKERQEKRSLVRAELSLTDDDILFVHSGKLDKLKKTADLLIAFSQVPDSRFHLIIVGSIGDDVQEELEHLIEQDPRIHFLGWKSGEELQDYLCACDMYLQPGSQSATMQNALCCGAPVMLYPHKSHKPYLKGNGFYVKNTDEMVLAFQAISQTPEILPPMREKSLVIASRLLDYRKLAARLYQKK